jgi:hypothetical protein
VSTEDEESGVRTGRVDRREQSDERRVGPGYTHRPLDGDSATTADHAVVHPEASDREFGRRGWLLVGVLFVAFVVAPVTIYLVPPSASAYFTVLIVFPLLPALLLAAVAVWATTRP